ncbi:hypothetical protein QJS10_CPA09g00769 [Acorus calamus]|uniref:Uncharacterized protein n=1 Tax=Acorus calamus TaxID=4465 RepID=A0AAV9E2B5_ACOCL|nr:hypothetical protein QJS10_CPA09g00769 [Acorus calamus]
MQKSFMHGVNTSMEEEAELAAWMGCSTAVLPTKHLGLPLVKGRLKKEQWDPLIERFERRLAGWHGKLLSWGAADSLASGANEPANLLPLNI